MIMFMDIGLASIIFVLAVSATILALYLASLGLVPRGWRGRFAQGIALEEKTYLVVAFGLVMFYGLNHLFDNPISNLAESSVLVNLLFGILLLIGGIPSAWDCFCRARLLNRGVRVFRGKPRITAP